MINDSLIVSLLQDKQQNEKEKKMKSSDSTLCDAPPNKVAGNVQRRRARFHITFCYLSVLFAKPGKCVCVCRILFISLLCLRLAHTLALALSAANVESDIR